MQMMLFYMLVKFLPRSVDWMVGMSFPPLVEEEPQSEEFSISQFNKHQ